MTSVYLDASVLVPLFVDDRHTSRAHEFLASSKPRLVVSDFASAEFASALSRRVRTSEMSPEQAKSAFELLDVWTTREAHRIEVSPADIRRANAMLRGLDLALRTPDAVNIAMAERSSAILLTFDLKMSTCALRLGVATELLR